MGYTVLVRWKDADEKSFGRIAQQITGVHGGATKGQWQLYARFYKSTTWPSRSINTMTTGDTCFVLCEDTSAPGHVSFENTKRATLAQDPNAQVPARPSHYKSTSLTLSPPTLLGLLFQQIGGGTVWSNWMPGALPDIEINGAVFQIGEDLIIRVGRVIQKNQPRGLVIEAELIPLPRAPGPGEDPRLLQELITAVAPTNADVKAVSLTEEQWNEILAGPDQETTTKTSNDDDDDDLFTWPGKEDETSPQKDWIGPEREKRSAFLLLKLLVTEGTQR